MEVSRQGGTQPWEQLSSNGRVAPHPGPLASIALQPVTARASVQGPEVTETPTPLPLSPPPCSCPGPPSPELFPADSGHSKGTTSSPWLRAGDASNR